mmetsp:Transcript_7797/g.14460  ORF Transcript_7797/g.14460 Transcript_7797/m.14460 type:complete len:408 (-) Transcript_7797:155-1378(-)
MTISNRLSKVALLLGALAMTLSSRLADAKNNSSRVSVDKACFRKGETIDVYFEDIFGKGVWVGIYSTSAVSDFDNLPGFSSGDLTAWVFSCGEHLTCDEWPSKGKVQFSTEELNPDEYVVVVSGDRADLAAQATTNSFAVDFTCEPISDRVELAASQWQPAGFRDQRSPCPFINTLANHGIINRNGTFIDLFDMAARLEAVYNVDRAFLHHGPVQLAIDCNQTYEDKNGITRLDLERLFDDRCEEHEASMVRADSFHGFESSKLVDDSLLNRLMRKNPTSKVLTREDVMDFQSERIMESRISNPETVFRPFDIENMGAQGIFLFLLSSDPTLETVEKEILYFFLLMEKLPDGFVPGSLRDTPFNFLDPTDFTQPRFMESMGNVESMMHISIKDSGGHKSVYDGRPHH